MIDVRLSIDDTSTRGSRGKAWTAETITNGKPYTAQSRSSASYALARELVNDGIADQPMRVRQDGLAGHITFRSLYRMAGRMIAESATTPITTRKWSERTFAAAA